MATPKQLAALKKARAAKKKAPVKKKAPAKRKVAAKKKAPVSKTIKYHVTVNAGGEIYYLVDWTKRGALMDTEKSRAKTFDAAGANALASAIENVHPGTNAIVKKLNATPKKNPVPPSSVARQIKEAGALFQEFTGHDADYYDTVPYEPVKVGLKVGTVDAILYTTVRDGIMEHYKHDFRKSSRPTLVASHNGKALALVGGKYRFTDRGIVDI